MSLTKPSIGRITSTSSARMDLSFVARITAPDSVVPFSDTMSCSSWNVSTSVRSPRAAAASTSSTVA